MHYTAGLGGLASLGGASLAAEQSGAAPVARILLEASGGLFVLYLIVMVAILIHGRVIRHKAAAPPAHALVRGQRLLRPEPGGHRW